MQEKRTPTTRIPDEQLRGRPGGVLETPEGTATLSPINRYQCPGCQHEVQLTLPTAPPQLTCPQCEGTWRLELWHPVEPPAVAKPEERLASAVEDLCGLIRKTSGEPDDDRRRAQQGLDQVAELVAELKSIRQHCAYLQEMAGGISGLVAWLTNLADFRIEGRLQRPSPGLQDPRDGGRFYREASGFPHGAQDHVDILAGRRRR